MVSFFKGRIRTRKGDVCDARWANTAFGPIVLLLGHETSRLRDAIDVVEKDLIAEFELPGVDRAGVEAVAEGILTRGYLDHSGIKGKDDAVLFLLVNEAIHSLEEIDAWLGSSK